MKYNFYKKFRIYFFTFCALCLLLSCQQKEKDSATLNESTTATKETVKIIFDTDMGSDCDDVGALALLHTYADEGKAEILGCIYSSGKVPYGAGVIDAINRYYNRTEIPIGATYDTLVGDSVDKMGAEKLAKSTAIFGNTIIHNKDAEEQTQLNRKLLVAQEDNSVVYITIGHTKGLYDLLVSSPDDISPLSGHELIAKKLKHWVALGALNANNIGGNRKKDWNFFFNGTASYTAHLVKHVPVPIYFVNGGSKVMTGKTLENTAKGNIVRQAYTDWLNWHEGRTLGDQRPSWDLVTVYFAVEGLGTFFKFETAGWLDYDVEKGCIWKKGENDLQHNYITQIDSTDDAFADYLNELIAKAPSN